MSRHFVDEVGAADLGTPGLEESRPRTSKRRGVFCFLEVEHEEGQSGPSSGARGGAVLGSVCDAPGALLGGGHGVRLATCASMAHGQELAMNTTLYVVVRRSDGALARVLRSIHQKGWVVRRLVARPTEDGISLEVLLTVEGGRPTLVVRRLVGLFGVERVESAVQRVTA